MKEKIWDDRIRLNFEKYIPFAWWLSSFNPSADVCANGRVWLVWMSLDLQQLFGMIYWTSVAGLPSCHPSKFDHPPETYNYITMKINHDEKISQTNNSKILLGVALVQIHEKQSNNKKQQHIFQPEFSPHQAGVKVQMTNAMMNITHDTLCKYSINK